MSMSAVLHPAELRRVFGAFPSGVTAVAAMLDGAPVGLAASSFTSVSLEPPLVSICIARTSNTWRALRHAGQEHRGRQLSARGGDRFAGVTWRATRNGEILLDGACAWLDCSIEREIPAGDHDIVLLRVHALDADRGVAPLVFHHSAFGRLLRAA